MLLNKNILDTNLIGRTFLNKIYLLKETGSTNDYAKELKEDNVLVVSEFQKAGKGRNGRMWESEKRKNLTFSISKKIDIDIKNNHFVNFFFTYFLYESLNEFLSAYLDKDTYTIGIKWPNDILVNKKKAAGVLIENLNKQFIIGIGINVNQINFKINSKFNITSLTEVTNEILERNHLLIRIIKTFDSHLELLHERKFTEIYNLWVQKCDFIGKKIAFIVSGNEKHISYLKAINEDGSIVVSIDGQESCYNSGEIELIPNSN